VHQGEEDNLPFVMPKRIARVRLDKEKLTYKQMAGIIRTYLNDNREYALRIIKRDVLYQECPSLLSLFDVMGSGYGLYGDTSYRDIEGQIGSFMKNTKFKYEIVRSDLVNVYNYR